MRGQNLITHGMWRNHRPELRIWQGMMRRCHGNNPNRKSYHLYQGRGITVCERWHDPLNFLADMGPRPSTKHTVERKDNSAGYSPDNCVWATRKEQCRNRRDNVLLSIRGETKTVAEWVEIAGANRNTVHSRLKRGWELERALYTPAMKHGESLSPERRKEIGRNAVADRRWRPQKILLSEFEKALRHE